MNTEDEKQRIERLLHNYSSLLDEQLGYVVLYSVFRQYLKKPEFCDMYHSNKLYWCAYEKALAMAFIVGLGKVVSSDKKELNLVGIIESVEQSCKSRGIRVAVITFEALKETLGKFQNYYDQNWRIIRDKLKAHAQRKISSPEWDKINGDKCLKELREKIAILFYIHHLLLQILNGSDVPEMSPIESLADTVAACQSGFVKPSEGRSDPSNYNDLQRDIVADTVTVFERMINSFRQLPQ